MCCQVVARNGETLCIVVVLHLPTYCQWENVGVNATMTPNVLETSNAGFKKPEIGLVFLVVRLVLVTMHHFQRKKTFAWTPKRCQVVARNGETLYIVVVLHLPTYCHMKNVGVIAKRTTIALVTSSA